MIDISPDMKLRLPMDLRRAVEGAAKANRRSLNAEITARLEYSFLLEAVADPASHGSNGDAGWQQAVRAQGQEIEALRAEVRALSMQINAKAAI
ncbi:Arc family DNA-binding protein [Novosphingobium sp. FSW06-99]|uniref:Arc family DNA-binding protein n=1 Tax=Novosphingobium sp. FSW06-99 TaxID=1739113 RepID=UPI00076D32EB|nr:Arc family DNA-binding protein [Novosphingobium sp. FSW06-99]KUR75654.1 hypothetical protein AQZ49_14435 [Novosphingobium sp. FSW06-99]